MNLFLILLMALNATVFFFGAVLHAGVVIGPFRQPQIYAASVVEILCGLALVWGAIALFKGRPSAGRAALIANLIATAGVLLGVVPRLLRRQGLSVIALDHRIMLVLIGLGLFSIARRPHGIRD